MKEKTILLVEDDFLNRRLYKKTLEEQQAKVLSAKNAAEALDFLKRESIDLVVLDINLGEAQDTGIDLAKHIKNQFNKPFIFLTAYEDGAIMQQALETLPYSYLTKPFKTVDLIACIQLTFNKIKETHNSEEESYNTLLVKDEDYTLKLMIKDINYIECDKNYLLIHTNQKAYKYRSTMKEILTKLPSNKFIQIHRAFIINKDKVEKFSPQGVIIANTNIPSSKNFIEDFMH